MARSGPVAANGDGERVRRHGIRLEREIRKLVAEGVGGPLSKLWDIAAARIGAKPMNCCRIA